MSLQEVQSVRYSVIKLRHADVHVPSTATAPQRIDAKRAIDIVIGGLALILLAPAMIFLYVMLSISGGAVFAQRRVGKGGRLFYCYKFRSMVHNADKVLAEHLERDCAAREEWNRAFKLANDPRVTWAGRLLRRTSLDELPQLFNVLAGDMSLVGPRPIVPDEIGKYADKIKAYYKCRPGITGLWQISGRNLVTYERRVVLDAIYARKQSVRFDALILFKTVRVVLTGWGAC